MWFSSSKVAVAIAAVSVIFNACDMDAQTNGIQLYPASLRECDPAKTVTVSWNFKNKQDVSLPISVYVAPPGKMEKLFFTTGDLAGKQDAPWAGANMTFVAR